MIIKQNITQIALLTVLGAGLGVAAPVHAAAPSALITPAGSGQAGYYRFVIGKTRVTALSDGTLPLEPGRLLSNTTPEQVASSLAERFQGPSVDVSVNAYLIETTGRLILVDAGTGTLFGPTLNKLPASLQAMGYKSEQVTDILVTHIHADHTGGLTSGKRMVYPNATLHLARKELDYWMGPASRARAPKEKRKSFDDGRKAVQPYLDAGRVRTFDGSAQLFPGIRTMPSPGHTPGHSFYVLDSEGERLVFWGDLLHFAEIQFPHPDVTISFDVDPAAARSMRRQAFADAAKGRYLVAPAHVAFPGTGHIRAEGEGYRWVPTTYRNDDIPAAVVQ